MCVHEVGRGCEKAGGNVDNFLQYLSAVSLHSCYKYQQQEILLHVNCMVALSSTDNSISSVCLRFSVVLILALNQLHFVI